jgi:hypothetical protein
VYLSVLSLGGPGKTCGFTPTSFSGEVAAVSNFLHLPSLNSNGTTSAKSTEGTPFNRNLRGKNLQVVPVTAVVKGKSLETAILKSRRVGAISQDSTSGVRKTISGFYTLGQIGSCLRFSQETHGGILTIPNSYTESGPLLRV